MYKNQELTETDVIHEDFTNGDYHQAIALEREEVVEEAFLDNPDLEEVKLVTFDDIDIPKYKFISKRLSDLFLVLISLPLTLPLALITATLIKLGSRGPVLFTQQRMGQNGEPFTMIKFRSMRLDSEVDGAQFADEEDDRVTPFGKFIRKYRIDEIPQFWNILKGEMSLIGPRPEQVDFAREFGEEIPNYNLRHICKPGITGWAQVNNGYAACTSTIRKLKYDLEYLKDFSLKMDLQIIWMTIKTILTGFGAR
jgi:exopolysaccharide biosynthesis polyprenyl glycosylphosphotransferase